MTSRGDFPCQVSSIRRPIPEAAWYARPTNLIIAGGVLPFGSIFIEMYFLFTSFLHHKFYYVYGFLLLVYIMLFIVVVCVTINSTYIQLNAEDYRWPWTSFLVGGSTAFYVFGYVIYFYFMHTNITGFFQTSFYFGYMSVLCLALFLVCGMYLFIYLLIIFSFPSCSSLPSLVPTYRITDSLSPSLSLSPRIDGLCWFQGVR